jgi:transcriptional regulator with XRE-family HTH domain
MSIPHPLIGLKSVRKHRGFSLSDAASVVGVHPTSYNRFENGTRRIYLDKAVALAQALRCTVDDLTHLWSEDELFARLGPAGPAPEAAKPPPPPPGLAPAPLSEADTVVAAAVAAEWELDQ